MPQKGTEKRRSSEKVISTDKAALLWMYCKKIAPFETPTFSKNAGEVIARATRGPQQLETQEQLIAARHIPGPKRRTARQWASFLRLQRQTRN